MTRTHHLVGMLIALHVTVSPGGAEQPSAPTLDGAIEMFELGEWEDSVPVFNELLASGSLGPEERIAARKYLGWIHIRLDDEKQAVIVFKALAAENPSFRYNRLSLEEGQAPPDELNRAFLQAVLELREEEEQLRLETLQRTSRGPAMLRSALVPGWGQRYQGHKGRSLAVLAATAATAVWAVVADRSYRTARDDYDNAGPGSDFDSLFDDYSSKSDTADLALGVFAAAWALNLLDAASSGPNLGGLSAVASSGPAGRNPGMRFALVKGF